MSPPPFFGCGTGEVLEACARYLKRRLSITEKMKVWQAMLGWELAGYQLRFLLAQGAQPPHFRPDERYQRYHQNSAEAAQYHRSNGAEQLRRDA